MSNKIAENIYDIVNELLDSPEIIGKKMGKAMEIINLYNNPLEITENRID